ncbi:hypothetical protein IAT38_007196 [Cryptococcus sp. DSM 104549]
MSTFTGLESSLILSKVIELPEGHSDAEKKDINKALDTVHSKTVFDNATDNIKEAQDLGLLDPDVDYSDLCYMDSNLLLAASGSKGHGSVQKMPDYKTWKPRDLTQYARTVHHQVSLMSDARKGCIKMCGGRDTEGIIQELNDGLSEMRMNQDNPRLWTDVSARRLDDLTIVHECLASNLITDRLFPQAVSRIHEYHHSKHSAGRTATNKSTAKKQKAWAESIGELRLARDRVEASRWNMDPSQSSAICEKVKELRTGFPPDIANTLGEYLTKNIVDPTTGSHKHGALMVSKMSRLQDHYDRHIEAALEAKEATLKTWSEESREKLNNYVKVFEVDSLDKINELSAFGVPKINLFEPNARKETEKNIQDIMSNVPFEPSIETVVSNAYTFARNMASLKTDVHTLIDNWLAERGQSTEDMPQNPTRAQLQDAHREARVSLRKARQAAILSEWADQLATLKAEERGYDSFIAATLPKVVDRAREVSELAESEMSMERSNEGHLSRAKAHRAKSNYLGVKACVAETLAPTTFDGASQSEAEFRSQIESDYAESKRLGDLSYREYTTQGSLAAVSGPQRWDDDEEVDKETEDMLVENAIKAFQKETRSRASTKK